MKEEVRLGRPSIIATLLWAFGIVVIGLTVYCMINWPSGWTENLHDILLVLVSFSTGINAIATVTFNGKGVICNVCGSKKCRHVEYVPNVRKVRNMLYERGWKISLY